MWFASSAATISRVFLLWKLLSLVGASSSTTSSSFLWLSDIHLDPFYGTENATHPECAVNDTSTKFGQFGCDSPPTLVHSALKEAMPFDHNVEFVIITGDLSRHFTDQLNNPMDATKEILLQVSELLKSALPDVTIVPAVGNNDVTPDYYLETNHSSTDNPMLEMMSQGLNDLFESDTERETFLKGGYFARNVTDTLTVISLNTVVYSTSHEPRDMDPEDPFDQFAWLEEQLAIAQNASRSVYIIGHIPPSIGSYRHAQLWEATYAMRYYQALEDHPGVVKGQLFGHLHSDEFRVPSVQANNMTSNTSVLLLAPSITPVYGSNPSIRVAHYESDSGTLLDYDTYYMDLKHSDETSTSEWILSPSFRDSFGIPDMSRTSITEGIVNKLRDDPMSPLWTVLLSRQHVYADDIDSIEAAAESCSHLCQKEWLCTFESVTMKEYLECLVLEDESSRMGIISVLVGILLAIIAAIGGKAIVDAGGPMRCLKRLAYHTTTEDEGIDYGYDANGDYNGGDKQHPQPGLYQRPYETQDMSESSTGIV